jgi:signal peptidase II
VAKVCWQGSPAARFLPIVALVLLDQWSKARVFAWIDADHERKTLLGEWLAFWTSCNKGAAFGQFGDFPYALVLGRAVAVLFLCWLVLRADSRPRLVLVAMALVLAGATGNLIDNLWTGCPVDGPFLGVRDFIDVDFQPLIGWDRHFPAFNVADSCITVGACAWILSGFRRAPAGQPAPQAGPDG